MPGDDRTLDEIVMEIAAKEVTPFLLGRIVELTEGRSLQSNTELVLNNARLGAAIAAELARQAADR